MHLVERLLAARPAWVGLRAEVEAELARFLAAARDALPEVPTTDEELVDWLAERLPEDTPAEAFRGVYADDLLLACACAGGSREALAVFEGRYGGALAAAARRIDRDPEVVDEVVQRVRVKLFVGDGGEPGIASYLGRGPLRAWLQVTTSRIALSMRRSVGRRREDHDDDLLDALPDVVEPEHEHIRDRYRRELEEAFQDSLQTLSVRERNVLRQYLLDGLNIDAIGRMYGAHRATVARWIGAAREKLLLETRRTLCERLGIASTDADSLITMMRSQLDLSIVSFLRRDAD